MPADVLDQLNRNSATVRTLITHDSFFARISSQVRAAFPNAVIMRGTADASRVQSQIASADRLIVSFVERGLVYTITEGTFDWKATIPSAIVARNQRLAEQCSSFEAVEAAAVGSPAGIGEDIGATIAVREVSRQDLPCLRISLAVSVPTTVSVALPETVSGALAPEHLIKFRVQVGDRTVGLVLPHHASGSRIGLGVEGLGETAAVSAIAIGQIARPRLAVAD